MGLYTFLLYLLIFGALLFAEECTEREFHKISRFSCLGIIVDLVLWVCDSLGSLSKAFLVFCWGSFLYFTLVLVYLYLQIRKESGIQKKRNTGHREKGLV